MKTKLFILLAVLLMPLGMMAQEQALSKELKILADSIFYSGDYVNARKQYLIIYIDYDDSYAFSQIRKCADCVSYMTEAANAERDENYDKAIAEYKKVYLLNPKDPKIQGFVEACQKRQYGLLLSDARSLFKEGKYQKARTKLKHYMTQSGKTDAGLLSSITECLTWQAEARNAFENKDYTSAKSYYNKILSVNPTDAISATAIAEINRLSTPVKTVYVEKKSNNFVLKPSKNHFDLYMLSGFSEPYCFGGGIGGNTSYFQMNLDAGGRLEEQNYTQIDAYTFRRPTVSIILTPGVNLKYFSIGFGLGAFLCKDKIYQEIQDKYPGESYHEPEHSSKNKSFFMMRPSLTWNIPFYKDFSGGLTITAGYNIVSGASDMNQFVIGLGFFF